MRLKTTPERLKHITDYKTDIFGVVCVCKKHKKEWPEGDDFEENGGRACRECVEATGKEANNAS